MMIVLMAIGAGAGGFIGAMVAAWLLYPSRPEPDEPCSGRLEQLRDVARWTDGLAITRREDD